MPWNRGDVVLAMYPNSNLRTAKSRPALVVQADLLNTGLAQTVLVMITSNLARAGHASRILVRAGSPLGKQMSLLHDSVIATDNVATVFDSEIRGVIGTCGDMTAVDAALRHTLGL
jgi:mRNA interferase MazF